MNIQSISKIYNQRNAVFPSNLLHKKTWSSIIKKKKKHNFNFATGSRFHFPSNEISAKKGSSYDVGWRHILFRNQFFYYTSKNKTVVKLAMFSTIKIY